MTTESRGLKFTKRAAPTYQSYLLDLKKKVQGGGRPEVGQGVYRRRVERDLSFPWGKWSLSQVQDAHKMRGQHRNAKKSTRDTLEG